MALVDLTYELHAADSLPDLSRRLGAICLDQADRLIAMKDAGASREKKDEIVAHVERISVEDWERAIADPASFPDIAGEDLLAALRSARMRQPLDFLGLLLGLCQGALDRWFRACVEELRLDRGMPIPFATRPPPEGVEWMTWQGTQAEGGLLEPLAWTLFPYPADEGPTVVLDHSHRNRIDELAWIGRERLPRIASVHPPLGPLESLRTRSGKFFDVRPKDPDPGSLLEALSRGREAEIGVLPELCLARPDELSERIAADPGAYPPLIVAGSAHVREGRDKEEVRANESLLYLDGVPIASHRKVHPFKTKVLGGVTYSSPLQEDLSREPKTITVLAAGHTRLAVVICADLLDERVPNRLVAAGVNLLAAPAMTTKSGSFETTVEAISGRCQGVSAVVNSRMTETGKPFLCMLGTPRAERAERFAQCDCDGVTPPPELAIFDSHEPLPSALSWGTHRV